MNQHSPIRKKYYPVLISAALLAASLFHFPLPVYSAGTEAGTTIRNTATGKYKDDAGQDYTIESNTVEVTVAKVAGITNQIAGFTDLDPDNNALLTGDRVSFEFEITNVGNDVTDIFIPALADIATKGLSSTTLVLQVSPALNADGTQASDNSSFSFDDNTAAATQPRPNEGLVKDVPINGKVLVKVTGNVSATAAGALIEVLLGDTPPNGNPNAPLAATQNQPDDTADSGDGSDNQAKDIRTVEADTTSTSSATLLGGEKEASALQQQVLGSIPLAMARIEKVRGTVVGGATLQDNVIPYKLDLEVLNTTPNSLFTPGNLEGREYGGRIDGFTDDGTANDADSNLILVSDAIPAGTVLEGTPTSPANWTVVYTDDTTGLPQDDLNWTTNPVSLTNPVSRIGWVYDARTGSGNGALEAGIGAINSTFASGATSATGFTFEVRTSGLTGNGGSVANIAQVFGSTVNGEDIFDESGDQDPSNFNGTTQGPGENNALSTGIADPNTHGIDSENNNNANGADTATPGGEDNVITFGAPGTIINGPRNQAGAIGNIFGEGPDNQHDFQNLGVSTNETGGAVTATPGGTSDPEAVTFRNTFVYPDPDPSTPTDPLSNVRLQPVAPNFVNLGGAQTDLPNGTQVDIILGGRTATYIYDDTDGSFDIQGLASTAITIPSLNPDTPLNYDVVVNLPGNTPFSTDNDVNQGFPVPIIVFSDSDNDGTPDINDQGTTDTLDDTFTGGNITVNQVYTGFMKIVKQVRVLDPDGNERTGMGFNDPSSAKTPLPGDILEYQVIYRNISEPQAGDGTNVILNGVEMTIEENGTIDAVDGLGTGAEPNGSGNNWGLDNNDDGDLDTIHVQNSASDTNNGTIEFFTGGPGVTLGDLVPAGQTDPGDTVTGYRLTLDAANSIPPAGAEDLTVITAPYAPYKETVDNGDFVFKFRRTVDEFDGLPQEGLD